MKPSRGYYCIIQFCPDLGRLEAANVGVLLFCPDLGFLKARMSRDNTRIRHFFGNAGLDWNRINSFKTGIEERLEVEREEIRTLEALETFISRRANLIQISPPRPMKVTEPEKDLDQLFADLVGRRFHWQRRPSLRQYLGKKFESAGLNGKIQKNITVRVPISERTIEIPFGFQNSQYNLIQVESFQNDDSVRAKSRACKYAVEGESLYKNPDPQLGSLQLILVGRFGSGSEQSRVQEGVRRILKHHHVQLYALKELEHDTGWRYALKELNNLLDEIKRTARDRPGTTSSTKH